MLTNKRTPNPKLAKHHPRLEDRSSRPTLTSSRLDRAVARTLIALMIWITPFPAFSGEEFTDADQAILITPGSIDNTIAGETTIESTVLSGETLWTGGLNQPTNNTLIFELQDGATHLNRVDGDFAAHLNGTVIAPSASTVVFASPFGVFIGDQAVFDVGSVVAIGGAQHDITPSGTLDLTAPVENHGLIRADGDVLLLGSEVTNTGDIQAGTGDLLMLAGDSVHFVDSESVIEGLLGGQSFLAFSGDGRVKQSGTVTAENATLFGAHVVNQGKIEIRDGSLMLIGADAVYVSEFDNPVLIRLPHTANGAGGAAGTDGADTANQARPEYAVENQGQIDAGLGHVRLAASDPLGFGIRQGTASNASNTTAPPAAPSISAAKIEIEAGGDGRVDLAGRLDAETQTPDSAGAESLGGEIDITGGIIILSDADIDASGDIGGGTIQIGGEQQGRGALPRARAVLVDADTEIHADALIAGDGGRVIVFSEDLTSIEGTLTARGGSESGNGGFVETSGLRHLQLATTPDVTAPAGLAGEWLIDPYSIEIVADDPALDCTGASESCLNRAVEAILSPNFDTAAFDDILRTVAPTGDVPFPNQLSVDLLVRALAVGTNITLSTESFLLDGTDPAEAPGIGDITISTPIEIRNPDTLEGTRAQLTLRAAGSIFVNEDISTRDAGVTDPSDLRLDITLRANDQAQRQSALGFGPDQLIGNVNLNANVRTGTGNFTASGIAVIQDAASSIETDGGDVLFVSGTLDGNDTAASIARLATDDDPFVLDPSAPVPVDVTYDPRIEIAGTIDTSNGRFDGGNQTYTANSILVNTGNGGSVPVTIETAQLEVTGSLVSGNTPGTGGTIDLRGGTRGTLFAGNVDLTGANIQSSGGNVTVDANRVDTRQTIGDFIPDFAATSVNEGGAITISGSTLASQGGTLSVGSANTQTISIDGTLTSLGGAGGEDGLVAIVADDASGSIDNSASRFGRSRIELGTNSATTIESAGVAIEGRDILTGGTGSLAVTVSGQTESAIARTDLGLVQAATTLVVEPLASEGVLAIDAARSITFGAGTALTADLIQITAAANPLALNTEEIDGLGNSLPAEDRVLTRLSFEGVGGNTASAGVRLSANDLQIEIGDGITTTTDLLFEDPGTDVLPTDLGLQRGSRGDFSGLQLRDVAGNNRPERVSIRQDGALTLTTTAAAGPSELFLGERSGTAGATGAFGAASIGANGQRVTLESSDGVLQIDTARGLSSDSAPGAGDAGRSFVSLRGGVLLGTDANTPEPASDSLIVSSPLVADDAFNVESLRLSTPRNLTVTAALADSIASAGEIVIEAGRNTGVDEVAQDGTLTIEAGSALQATERLALHAGASGFGNLVFADGATTTLSSDAIEMRAGAGAFTLNTTGGTSLSRIEGVTGVEFRDSSGADFDGRTQTDLQFSYRQDAPIDTDVDLPSFDNFSSAMIASFVDRTVPGGNPAVQYAIRSDRGGIDFRGDALGGARFTNASLSVIGSSLSGTLPIQIDEGFSFIGPEIELGSTDSFVYDLALANAFNPDPTANPIAARDLVRLRAGLGGVGTLSLGSGFTIRAPRVELIASDGTAGSTGSSINVGGAQFDLSDGALGERVFVFQEDRALATSSLPSAAAFVGGALPNTLVLRTDSGSLDLAGFDITTLPLLLDGVDGGGADVAARLVLEADSITLSPTSGENLALTASQANPDAATDALRNVRLRLRANTLTLEALGADTATGPARVLLGERAGDGTTAGLDSAFDNESLLIEAFDETSELASPSNLTSVSEVENAPGQFDLAGGRGLTNFALSQVSDIDPSELANRNAVSGHFARSRSDDENDIPIATTYSLVSSEGSVTVRAENVSGSALNIGDVFSPATGDIRFDFDSDVGASNDFTFASLNAVSEGSIFVADGTELNAEDSLLLAAAFVDFEPTADEAITAANPMGNLVFENTSGGTTTISGNLIQLAAGRNFPITNPDGTNGAADGERDEIDNALLAQIDFRGLARIDNTGTQEISAFSAIQSRAFDTRTAEGDVITPLLTPGSSGDDEWGLIDLASAQGQLTVDRISELSTKANGLALGRANDLATVVVESNVAAPFDDAAGNADVAGFEGLVRLESNEITIRAVGVSELDLNAPGLRIVSDTFRDGTETDAELGRVPSDPEALDRPILRIEQPGDFAATQLPRPNLYFQRVLTGVDGEVLDVNRATLENLEIELVTTGTSLVLGDEIRERTFLTNLVLRSAGDVTIQLSGLTPGFADYDFAAPDIDPLDFAALQLTSLEIHANDGAGTIRVAPFLPFGSAEDLTIDTAGDQLFDGFVSLEQTLATRARDFRITGDLFAAPGFTAGLLALSNGQLVFEGDLGRSDAVSTGGALSELFVVFDNDTTTIDTSPNVQFGPRTDSDGDGLLDATDQEVIVDGNTAFVAANINEPDDPLDETDSDFVESLREALRAGTPVLANAAGTLGRPGSSPAATIGKPNGNLTFRNGPGGQFLTGEGEKLAVGGTLSIETPGEAVTLGDVAALDIQIDASEIALIRRVPSLRITASGATTQDGGGSIAANTIDFGGALLSSIGSGKTPRFGVPNPFDATATAAFADFPLFANTPSGGELTARDFAFASSDFADQTVQVVPEGASRSDLTGAFGPGEVPLQVRRMRDRAPLNDADGLLELDVDARQDASEVQVARLTGAALIDDYSQSQGEDTVLVSASRLDARDADAAVRLYEELFGPGGERTEDVRNILQDALDQYLETTRARRVIGFELRRFVKNRPSTLLDAYSTLESLDSLFRYHRRLGLSPGEFRTIQRGWLEDIQPEGITTDELSETIHPSRYVRGSDILDIFGR